MKDEKREIVAAPETEENDLTATLTDVLEEINEEKDETKPKGVPVTLLDEDRILVGDREYRLVKNHRDAFQPEKLGERYSDILGRYDYIVADWGYDQLRLKGFFAASDNKAPVNQRIDTLEDYLYEFCNFGCAYFVIERIGGKKEKNKQRKQRKQNRKTNKSAYVEEMIAPVNGPKKQAPVIKNRMGKKNEDENKNTAVNKPKQSAQKSVAEKNSKRKFTIRQKED